MSTNEDVLGAGLNMQCCCGQVNCNGVLVVIPLKINDHKHVDLITLGMGGTVLSDEDRARLAAILTDPEWSGA